MWRSVIILISTVVTVVVCADPYYIDNSGNTGTAAKDNILASNPNGQWTEYLNHDGATGTGDYETAYTYGKENVDCAEYCLNPLLLEASLADPQLEQKGLNNLVSAGCLRFSMSSSASASGYTGGIGAKCMRNNMLNPNATCVAICNDYNVKADCSGCVDMKIRFYCPENPTRCSNSKRALEAEERALEDKDFEIETELKKKREQKNKDNKRKLMELLKQVLDS